jgi:hypothetical protein
MRKTRRAWIVFGALLLIAGIHSCFYDLGKCWREIRIGSVYVQGVTGDGYWHFDVLTGRISGTEGYGFDLRWFKLGVYTGPAAWHVVALGNWFVLASLILIPAIALELCARRRRRDRGFPVEPSRNIAHAGE